MAHLKNIEELAFKVENTDSKDPHAPIFGAFENFQIPFNGVADPISGVVSSKDSGIKIECLGYEPEDVKSRIKEISPTKIIGYKYQCKTQAQLNQRWKIRQKDYELGELNNDYEDPVKRRKGINETEIDCMDFNCDLTNGTTIFIKVVQREEIKVIFKVEAVQKVHQLFAILL